MKKFLRATAIALAIVVGTTGAASARCYDKGKDVQVRVTTRMPKSTTEASTLTGCLGGVFADELVTAKAKRLRGSLTVTFSCETREGSSTVEITVPTTGETLVIAQVLDVNRQGDWNIAGVWTGRGR